MTVLHVVARFHVGTNPRQMIASLSVDADPTDTAQITDAAHRQLRDTYGGAEITVLRVAVSGWDS